LGLYSTAKVPECPNIDRSAFFSGSTDLAQATPHNPGWVSLKAARSVLLQIQCVLIASSQSLLQISTAAWTAMQELKANRLVSVGSMQQESMEQAVPQHKHSFQPCTSHTL
jgi:hypothetical protein